MTIRKTEQKNVPAKACVFAAAAVLAAEPMVDDEEDDEEEEDAEAADDGDGSEEGDDDAEAADDGEEEDDAGEAKASEGRGLTVVANSGQPMRNCFWWGTLAIDLQGIKSKARVPALMDHDVRQRVGVFEEQRITDRGLEMDGQFLKSSPLAKTVNAELRDGFPYEASVRVQPTRIEELGDGVKAEVNGYTLTGPAFIFRESELREVSLCTLGQDPNTAAAALAEGGDVRATFFTETEETDVSKKTETAADAVAAERARCKALRAAATPEQSELLARMLEDGTSLSDGLAELHTDLRTRFNAKHERRHEKSGESLGGGNAGESTSLAATLERIRKMPPSEAKFRKLYELDTALQDEFASAEAFVAYSMEPVNQR